MIYVNSNVLQYFPNIAYDTKEFMIQDYRNLISWLEHNVQLVVYNYCIVMTYRIKRCDICRKTCIK